MQDSYLNNNVNLYHVINPLEINRNYTQPQIQLTHQLLDKPLAMPKQHLTASSNHNVLQQATKRAKFSHAPNHVSSDGESSLSNESDSNSSLGSSELPKPLMIATKIESFQLKNVTNFAKSEPDTVLGCSPVPILSVNNATASSTRDG